MAVRRGLMAFVALVCLLSTSVALAEKDDETGLELPEDQLATRGLMGMHKEMDRHEGKESHYGPEYGKKKYPHSEWYKGDGDMDAHKKHDRDEGHKRWDHDDERTKHPKGPEEHKHKHDKDCDHDDEKKHMHHKKGDGYKRRHMLEERNGDRNKDRDHKGEPSRLHNEPYRKENPKKFDKHPKHRNEHEGKKRHPHPKKIHEKKKHHHHKGHN